MSVISLRLNENEEKILKEVSEFEGLGISSYIKKIIFENLEDEYDIKLADRAYKNHIATGMKTTSFEDLVKELGFDEVDEV
ncbi:MAG: type II toxin-antitoxin system RelB family antitoxin [Fusobacterium varium]|uniref:type II toxin-antitoxin system RelB family antitoxin n=1 Tax=Fusobacterium varium TaxID=856 RepID=UPI0039917BFD